MSLFTPKNDKTSTNIKKNDKVDRKITFFTLHHSINTDGSLDKSDCCYLGFFYISGLVVLTQEEIDRLYAIYRPMTPAQWEEDKKWLRSNILTIATKEGIHRPAMIEKSKAKRE